MFKSLTFTFLAFPMICFADAPFEYAGFSLKTDPSTFKEKYPTSIDDETSVWLSKTDSHDEVHFVEKRRIDGKDEIRLSFERPADQSDAPPKSWEAAHHARHPKCDAILSRLIKAYKQPADERNRVEERLNHRIRSWSNANESLSLDCYNLDGKGEFLAGELTIQSRK